jgi:hypothetical protein
MCDPAAPARELLTQLHSALGQLTDAAAEQQRRRAELGGRPAGGYARLAFFLVVIGLGFVIGWWVVGK